MVGQLPKEEERCLCGQPLHYSDPDVRALVEAMIRYYGANVTIKIPNGTGGWMAFIVPKHYIALHGIRARDLRRLAEAGLIEQA